MQLDRRILLVPTLAVGLASAAWLIGSGEPALEQTRPSTQFHWPLGAQQRYTVSVDSQVEIDGGTAGRYHHRLAGGLRIQVFARDDSGVELGCQFEHLIQRIDGKDCPDPMLESFFVVRAELNGRFTNFEFPQNLRQATCVRLRETLRMFQVVIPADAGESWTTEEADANGTFSVVYRIGRDGVVKKSRVKYAGSAARILKSTSTAVVATDGGAWLQTMDVVEQQRVTSETKQEVLVTATAALRRVADGSPWAQSADARLRTEAQVVRRLDDIVAEAKHRAPTAADRARVRSLIAELDRSGKLGNFLVDLRRLLDECPELASMIPDRIARGDLQDLTASALIHVLRLSGHDAAQHALLAVVSDPRQTKQNQLRAVIDLGGVAKPNEAMCRRLWAMSAQRNLDSELATTAILALGRAGKSLREGGHERYAELSERLLQALHAAPSSEERTAVLTAVGNTRDPGFVRDVATHLLAATPQERGAAAKALGHLPESRDLLRRALELETNPFVRSRLAEGLVVQGDPTAETLAFVDRSIATESDARTRLALARYLGEHLESFPQGRVTLEVLLENEPNDRIRKYVAGRIYRQAPRR